MKDVIAFLEKTVHVILAPIGAVVVGLVLLSMYQPLAYIPKWVLINLLLIH